MPVARSAWPPSPCRRRPQKRAPSCLAALGPTVRRWKERTDETHPIDNGRWCCSCSCDRGAACERLPAAGGDSPSIAFVQRRARKPVRDRRCGIHRDRLVLDGRSRHPRRDRAQPLTRFTASNSEDAAEVVAFGLPLAERNRALFSDGASGDAVRCDRIRPSERGLMVQGLISRCEPAGGLS
jgi:hypothetical protein